MPIPSPQRDFAEKVVRQLRDAGHESLWAGGCVRDELLGRMPKDYDVATSARPEQVRELFGHRRTLAIGAAFGVISILGGKDEHGQRLDPIEVATFRSDGAYIDGRHPTDVTFTTAEEDAQRRDFTMNGLFFDPLNEKLIDYVGGEQDLRAGILRAIGDPAARFREDKLRMLRAVRFATTFGFTIDVSTLAAIQSMAAAVEVVSAERIGTELRKVLQHPNRSEGMLLLHETGLMQPLLPSLTEKANQLEPAWFDLLDQLNTIESDSLPVAFAALFSGCDDLQSVRDQGRRFRFTNKEIERTAWLIEKLPSIGEAAKVPWPRLQRVLVHEGAGELLALAMATWGADHAGVQLSRERLAWPVEKLNPQPLISGDDLVARGLRPGKYFGELLDHVRDKQLERQINDQQQAFDLVDQWLKDHPVE
ncbi:MAG: CCA tRNA nucleotidyltransferase [Planctomycetes bacterium]|nr:CCA tRNA nucleotidyltransferase [Planctomycetota bacterium]